MTVSTSSRQYVLLTASAVAAVYFGSVSLVSGDNQVHVSVSQSDDGALDDLSPRMREELRAAIKGASRGSKDLGSFAQYADEE